MALRILMDFLVNAFNDLEMVDLVEELIPGAQYDLIQRDISPRQMADQVVRLFARHNVLGPPLIAILIRERPARHAEIVNLAGAMNSPPPPDPGWVRRTNKTDAKRIQLVLGPGGVRCLAYVGALEVLQESGYEVTSVSAVSAALLVGVMWCRRMEPAYITDRLSSMETDRIFPGRPRLLRRLRYPFSNRPAGPSVDALLSVLGGDRTFGELKIPLATSAYDMMESRAIIWSSTRTPDILLSDALPGALAAPPEFPPHKQGAQQLIDGALLGSPPTYLVAQHPQEDPVLVLSMPPPALTAPPRNLLRLAEQVVVSSIWARGHHDIEQAKYAHVKISTDETDAYDFRIDRARQLRLVHAGRKAITQWVAQGALQRETA